MALRSEFRVVLFYYVSLRSEISVVMSYYVALRSEFRVVMSVTISPMKTMIGSSLPPVVCRRVHVLLTLFVFVYV